MQRFIRRRVETELVNEYQKNAEPMEEVKRKLEERVGDQWREEQGVQGREYILVLVKEERAQKRKWRESETRRIMDEERQKDEEVEEEERYPNCEEMNVEERNRESEDKEEERNSSGEDVNVEERKKESEKRNKERKPD